MLMGLLPVSCMFVKVYCVDGCAPVLSVCSLGRLLGWLAVLLAGWFFWECRVYVCCGRGGRGPRRTVIEFCAGNLHG